MTREHGLAFLLVAILTLMILSYRSANVRVDTAVEAARAAEDSIATLAPVLEALEVMAARQDDVVDSLRSSLTAERSQRALERAGLESAIETEKQEHETLIDSVIQMVDSATAGVLRRAQVADSLVHTNYERIILSQSADITGLEVELGAVTRQAALNRQGWDVSKELAMQAQEAAVSWASAYKAQKRKGLITNGLSILAVAAALAMR